MTTSVCLVMMAISMAAPGLGGQAVPGRTAASGPAGLTPYMYGARHCAPCHDQDNHPTYTKDERDGMICRMNESRRFEVEDKHKLAFTALTGPRGREIGRLLDKDVSQVESCVNCHSVPEGGIKKQQYVRETDGVTCVACHGRYAEWVERHQRIDNPEWLDLDRMAKEQRHGMTDLWDPVRRAETCASCHIGNHAQGKVVTHAMYAAGHPPLPSFEAATFSNAQPRHWEYLGEKRKRLPSPTRLKPPPDLKNLEQTQLVVVGALVALRESMKLFADEAANQPGPLGAQWPDFARFECYICHHDLQAQDGASWRQVRRRESSPGRPTTPDWPLVLVRLGIEAVDPQQAAGRGVELDGVLAALRGSLKTRPFGDTRSLIPAARMVAGWAESVIRDLDRTVFDAAKARVLIDRLCKMAVERVQDYDSARQIAWAFGVIYRESVPSGRRDPAIERELADLEAELALHVPPSRIQAPIETALAERLKKAAEFDPAAFQGHFVRIAKRITQTPTARAAERGARLLPRRSRHAGVDRVVRVVADLPDPAVVLVHPALLLGIQRSGSHAAEDADLVARLVHGTIAVEALRDRQGVGPRQLERGDELGRGSRAEPVVAGRLGRCELHHAQPVLAVGQIGELADIGDPQLHVVEVVNAPTPVEHLVDPRLSRSLDVEDHQALFPGRDVGVCPRQVDAPGITHR
jgi:hypothetical protein